MLTRQLAHTRRKQQLVKRKSLIHDKSCVPKQNKVKYFHWYENVWILRKILQKYFESDSFLFASFLDFCLINRSERKKEKKTYVKQNNVLICTATHEWQSSRQDTRECILSLFVLKSEWISVNLWCGWMTEWVRARDRFMHMLLPCGCVCVVNPLVNTAALARPLAHLAVCNARVLVTHLGSLFHLGSTFERQCWHVRWQ